MMIFLAILAIVEAFLLNKYYLQAKKYKRQKEVAMLQFQNLTKVFHEVCQKHGESILDYTNEVFGNKIKINS